MKRIAWGTVSGLGIAALLALGLPARAHDKSGTSGSSASGQSSDTSSPGSSATKSGSDTGEASSSSDTSGSSAPASDTSGTSASASNDQGTSQQLSGTVQKFDQDSKQLTLSSSDKTLKINDDTKVTKNGEEASASDIHEGDRVRASFSGSGDDVEVLTIEVVPADTTPATTGK
jgi:Cu/Ag efflux protein CusF